MNDEPCLFSLAELEYLYIVSTPLLYILHREVWAKVYQYKQESDKPLPSPLQWIRFKPGYICFPLISRDSPCPGEWNERVMLKS